jgi:hypothetical protein
MRHPLAATTISAATSFVDMRTPPNFAPHETGERDPEDFIGAASNGR